MALVNLDDAEAERRGYAKNAAASSRTQPDEWSGCTRLGTVPIRDDRDGPEERAIRTGQDALRALDVHLTTVVRKMARLREENEDDADRRATDFLRCVIRADYLAQSPGASRVPSPV